MAQHQSSTHDACSEHHDHSMDERYIWLELMYKQKSTEEETMVKWFAENGREYLASEQTHDSFTVVSFGCGDGKKDLAALGAIVQKLKPGTEIFYRGVDPDEKSLDKFRRAVAGNSDPSFSKVHFDHRLQTYEDYIGAKSVEAAASDKADLMFFIDSFCQLPHDPQEILLHCYNNELAPNGVIVVVLWNADDFWFKIRQVFQDEKPKVESDSDKGHDNAYLTVQEVAEVAKKNGLNFQTHTSNYTLDVSECFKPESMEGALMLEILACFANVPAMVSSPENRSKLLEFLSKESETKGNCRFLSGNHGIIVINKTSE